MPKVVTTSDEMDAELKAAGSKAVVVDFHATWCGPCKMIAPKLEEFASTYPSVVVLKVDVDDAEELAMKYEVTAMPTFLVIREGVVVDTVIGADVNKLKELFIKFNCDTAAAPESGATPGVHATQGADAMPGAAAKGGTPVIVEETPLKIEGPLFLRRSAKHKYVSKRHSKVSRSSRLSSQSAGKPGGPGKPTKPAKKSVNPVPDIPNQPVYPKKSVYVPTYVRNT